MKKQSKLSIFALSLVFLILLTSCGTKQASSAPAPASYPDDQSGYRAPTGGEITTEEAPQYDGATQHREESSNKYSDSTMPTPENSLAGESYLPIDETGETLVENQPLTTFSLKVDTAAYSNIERYLQSGNLPPKDAVRIEEMVNYFSYEQPMEFGAHPFSTYAEVGPSPLNQDKYIAFVRVKARDIDQRQLPSSNLTFLIDTSGSMNSHDKLPLLKEAFSLLTETLDEDDCVSIVTYAGNSAVVLDGVRGDDSKRINRAIQNLEAGGSTAGADGILTAYALAEKNFIKNGNNRIILATDGDFNVGVSNVDDLAELVSEKRGNDVYLSILGFGTGNLRDDIMETLSTNGNGNYSYIHSVANAKKVLVDELGSNLYTIADDVKAQIEFNPEFVRSYRLIGYENRMLENRDFEDDRKDAGEIGVGTDVVFMYELDLLVDPLVNGQSGLKYQTNKTASYSPNSELLDVRIRYKHPGEASSQLYTTPVYFSDVPKYNSSDFEFACAVAAFGHTLRNSEANNQADLKTIYTLAKQNLGNDTDGYRRDFLSLLDDYREIAW